MYLLFADETNRDYKENEIEFFVYGGMIVPVDKILDLDKGVQEIRELAGYKAENDFKFETNSRPAQVSSDSFKEAKKSALELCISNGCKLILYVFLHEIAKRAKPKIDINMVTKWGADHVIGRFNYFLTLNKDTGVVFVDRFSNVGEYNLLVEKFTIGLILESGGRQEHLDNIKIFSSSCNNASHISSLMDISLGSFRYCINSQNERVSKEILKKLVKLLWSDRLDESTIDPREKGISFRPRDIKNPIFKEKYARLWRRIANMVNS